jgi:hypothetical protein
MTELVSYDACDTTYLYTYTVNSGTEVMMISLQTEQGYEYTIRYNTILKSWVISDTNGNSYIFTLRLNTGLGINPDFILERLRTEVGPTPIISRVIAYRVGDCVIYVTDSQLGTYRTETSSTGSAYTNILFAALIFYNMNILV